MLCETGFCYSGYVGNHISNFASLADVVFAAVDQVVMGSIIGMVLGIGFRHLMKFCEKKNLIDRHSYVAQYISLAVLTIGVTTLLGSDDLLATFVCGTAFAWDGFFNKQTEESVFSSVIDILFNVAAFIYLGAWMPFRSFADATLTLSVWRLVVIAILVMLLRRIPAVLACYRWIPDIKTFREALFTGHFGPMGVGESSVNQSGRKHLLIDLPGAIFIATLATEFLAHSGKDDEQTHLLMETMQPIVAFMVLCSITIHGLSIPGFSLGRRVHSVSRTWSRHAPPDWTNQAQLVERGSDIVVNRDADPERGDLPPDEKLEGSIRRGSDTETGGTPEKVHTPENGSVETKRDAEDGKSGKVAKKKEDRAEVDTREEVPPDGDEIVAEWREGHHRVIERRAGPGEEVRSGLTMGMHLSDHYWFCRSKWKSLETPLRLETTSTHFRTSSAHPKAKSTNTSAPTCTRSCTRLTSSSRMPRLWPIL